MGNITDLDTLLEKMWGDYVNLNPIARQVVKLLEAQGEKVINDHIALRTFNHPKLCVDVMARPFLSAGYKECGEYVFEEKKLKAKHYEHENEDYPKIFISELLLEKFGSKLNSIVSKLIDQVDAQKVAEFDFASMGRPWTLKSEDYQELAKESEYASWLAAIGYRANHFTIFVNRLNKLSDLAELNQFLKDHGIQLNQSGGEIKGGREVYLEQSSTMASNVEISFSDKKLVIPSCYFEFAKRYPMENGKLYQGFVAKSADKIFESTNSGQ